MNKVCFVIFHACSWWFCSSTDAAFSSQLGVAISRRGEGFIKFCSKLCAGRSWRLRALPPLMAEAIALLRAMQFAIWFRFSYAVFVLCSVLVIALRI
ncbi:hypothetical protein SLE2022_125200 [Rubroshorea leprosula]